jgi:hypothetical protein
MKNCQREPAIPPSSSLTKEGEKPPLNPGVKKEDLARFEWEGGLQFHDPRLSVNRSRLRKNCTSGPSRVSSGWKLGAKKVGAAL